jgi:glutamate-1-semialdehyde aminotransferase
VDHRTSLTADVRRGLRFVDRLLDRGVLKAHEKFFVSTAHGDDDVAATIAAFHAAAEAL